MNFQILFERCYDLCSSYVCNTYFYLDLDENLSGQFQNRANFQASQNIIPFDKIAMQDTSTKRKLNWTKPKNQLVRLKKIFSYQNYHSLNELPRIGSGSVWIFVVHNIISIFWGFKEPTDVAGWWLTFLMMMYTISQEVFEPAPLNSEIVELFTMKPRSFDKIFLRLLLAILYNRPNL